MFSPEQKALIDEALTLLETVGRELGPNGVDAADRAVKAAREIEAARAAGTDVESEPAEVAVPVAAVVEPASETAPQVEEAAQA